MRTAAASDRPHLLPGWQDPVDPAALTALRREIHRTAEIGWAEFISTARLAQAFEAEGFKITYVRTSFPRSSSAGAMPLKLKKAGSLPCRTAFLPD